MTSARSVGEVMPAKAILVPGDVALRVRQEVVELVVGPGAALLLQRGRVLEARLVGALAVDDAPEMRADLVRAALLEAVAGGALLGRGLALVDGGAGQTDRQRLGLRLGRGAAGCLRLRLGQGIAGIARGLGMIDQLGDEARPHGEQQRAERGTRDLVQLERVHSRQLRCGRPEGGEFRAKSSACLCRTLETVEGA